MSAKRAAQTEKDFDSQLEQYLKSQVEQGRICILAKRSLIMGIVAVQDKRGNFVVYYNNKKFETSSAIKKVRTDAPSGIGAIFIDSSCPDVMSIARNHLVDITATEAFSA